MAAAAALRLKRAHLPDPSQGSADIARPSGLGALPNAPQEPDVETSRTWQMIPEPKTRAAVTDSSGKPATSLNQCLSGHDLNVLIEDQEMESRPVRARAGGLLRLRGRERRQQRSFSETTAGYQLGDA